MENLISEIKKVYGERSDNVIANLNKLFKQEKIHIEKATWKQINPKNILVSIKDPKSNCKNYEERLQNVEETRGTILVLMNDENELEVIFYEHYHTNPGQMMRGHNAVNMIRFVIEPHLIYKKFYGDKLYDLNESSIPWLIKEKKIKFAFMTNEKRKYL